MTLVTGVIPGGSSVVDPATLGAIEPTQLQVLAELVKITGNTGIIENTLVSVSGTGAGVIPAGAKAATIVFVGAGGSVNGVIRPNGWSQTFEYDNDLLPAIPYNGNGVATFYIDILT